MAVARGVGRHIGAVEVGLAFEASCAAHGAYSE